MSRYEGHLTGRAAGRVGVRISSWQGLRPSGTDPYPSEFSRQPTVRLPRGD